MAARTLELTGGVSVSIGLFMYSCGVDGDGDGDETITDLLTEGNVWQSQLTIPIRMGRSQSPSLAVSV